MAPMRVSWPHQPRGANGARFAATPKPDSAPQKDSKRRKSKKNKKSAGKDAEPTSFETYPKKTPIKTPKRFDKTLDF